MRGSDVEGGMRWVATIAGGLAVSAVAGIGLARWAVDDASGFYFNPVDRGPPAYLRDRPVLDGGYSAAAGSTATNVQPAYLSASGS